MDKKIKALFFDIDGTLVSFKTHKIPQSTVDALEQAKKNGVEVYISTGRPQLIINNLGQIEHLIDGYITTNGARCFVGDKVVSQHAILPEDVKTIIEAADRDDYPAIVVGEHHLETMAFGDGGNDISIVREAGIGVAMGNAGDNLKQIADYITTHVDEDGVKNALLHFGVI